MTVHTSSRGYSAIVLASAIAIALSTDAGAARQYWRGTDATPVWDTTTANWASDSTTSARTTYQSGTASTNPETDFDASGALDVTVDDGGVEAYVVNYRSGTRVWRGGPVTAQVLDPLGGNLTILNTVTLSPGSTSQYYGFRPRSGTSTTTIGDGGLMHAEINPYSNGSLNTRLVVSTNGTLKANFRTDSIKNNAFTLYFDGGTLIHKDAEDRTFTKSKFLLGAGGLHFQDKDGISSGAFQYLPGPILTDDSLASDGGIWFDEHIGYALLPNSTACTYNGGVHIDSAGGYVAARYNGSLGANPAAPTNNVFFHKSGARFVAHGSNGRLALNPNRDFFIADGVTARLMTWSGNKFSMLVQGAINCENVQNGVIETSSYSGINDSGAIAFCPTDGRTNHIGRLLVKAPTIIGSGTMLLENTTKLSVGTGANDENWAVNDGAVLNIASPGNGHLMVTGGVLRVLGSRNICQSAALTVSGGTVDFCGHDVLHGYSGKATTTIRDGGHLLLSSIRMAGDSSSLYGNPSNSVINLETGGVLTVTNKLYLTSTARYAMVNFDGGILDWQRPSTGWKDATFPNDANSTYNAATKANLVFNVLEGGMVISNNYEVYFDIPVVSGAESDGGLTKWGSATFSLKTSGNTFNGPIRIMQGDYRPSANNQLDAGKTAVVNSGAAFIMNTYAQTFARLEGSGTFAGVVKDGTTKLLSVTSAIAPGMGADELGTLTISGGGINISNGTALEIDVDAAGNSDSLSYATDLDLSNLTLVVNDAKRLNKDYTYTILTIPAGAAFANAFASIDGLPETWHVKYGTSSVELRYTNPFTLVVR